MSVSAVNNNVLCRNIENVAESNPIPSVTEIINSKALSMVAKPKSNPNWLPKQRLNPKPRPLPGPRPDPAALPARAKPNGSDRQVRILPLAPGHLRASDIYTGRPQSV